MATKKGLELIFNLQWKNNLDSKSDKSNVIGVYDTPAITRSFQTFKAYLLKNSGVAGNDVKVTHVTDDGSRWIIDSQRDFETALCAFRLKARLGEMIYLKLEKMSASAKRQSSNDVQTQIDNDDKPNDPPGWFTSYMDQFKKSILEEFLLMTDRCFPPSQTRLYEKELPEVSRKVKIEPLKKLRKHKSHGEHATEKDLHKTLKFDRKLEVKLDKLDAKTKKIKDKRQALLTKLTAGTKEGLGGGKKLSESDIKRFMDATQLVMNPRIPRVKGGTEYTHTWEICNIGMVPWTRDTKLRLNWGSADMKPKTYSVPCPLLKPGEAGKVTVVFDLPEKPGQYETYWTFYERRHRFGHWLNSTVIVENIKEKLEKALGEHGTEKSQAPKQRPAAMFPSPVTREFAQVFGNTAPPPPPSTAENKLAPINITTDVVSKMNELSLDSLPELSLDSPDDSLPELELVPSPKWAITNKYGIYDEDEDELVIDLSITNQSREIVERDGPSPVPREELFEEEKKEINEKPADVLEQPGQDDNNNNSHAAADDAREEAPNNEVDSDDSSNVSSSYDVVAGEACGDNEKDDSEKEESLDFVYVTIEDTQLQIPKKLYKDGLPKTWKDLKMLPEEQQREPVDLGLSSYEEPHADGWDRDWFPGVDTNNDAKSLASHCSTAATSTSEGRARLKDFRSRLFMFPSHNPGFEVVGPKSSEEGLINTSTFPPKGDYVKVGPLYCSLDGPLSPRSTLHLMGYEYERQPQKTPSQISSPPSCFFPPVPNFQQTPRAPDSLPPWTLYGRARAPQIYPHIPQMEIDGEAGTGPTELGKQYVPLLSVQQPLLTAQQPLLTAQQQQQQQQQQQHQQQQQEPVRSIPLGFREVIPPALQASDAQSSASRTTTPEECRTARQTPTMPSAPVHILPETLVSGAVNVASSAINTARSVINMIVPPKNEPDRGLNGQGWMNGHWSDDNPDPIRAKNMQILMEMGFWDIDRNERLLARYKDDITRVISELVR